MTIQVPLQEGLQIPLVELDLPLFKAAGVKVSLLRLDETHPQISGNKWFKLKYNLEAARESGVRQMLSFGGAWSNHIHALAFAGMQQGLKTIGVIRGERPVELSATLKDAKNWGMHLHFVSRLQYRDKYGAKFQEQLRERFGGYQLIPEGGSNALAVKGCSELVALIDQQCSEYDLICCACGTGATLAGIIAGKRSAVEVLGFPVLKGGEFLYEDISRLLVESGVSDPGGWRLQLDAHEGGYARLSPALADCLVRFIGATGIELEPVYTGKVMLALERMLAGGELPSGSRVVMIHSGGMQGLRGMREKLANQLNRFKNIQL
ncbi:MAG: pyridoxal-phosphate dependent enzyme [Amphritea sp.]